MNFKKRKSHSKGFTLIELLIVMLVVGVLSVITLVTYGNSRDRARDTLRRNDIKQYQNLFEIYYNANNAYPAGSGDLYGTCGTITTGKCSPDPVNAAPYTYRYSSSGTDYVLWAQLEVADLATGNDQYFVVCSNGLSGETTTSPGASCPL